MWITHTHTVIFVTPILITLGIFVMLKIKILEVTNVNFNQVFSEPDLFWIDKKYINIPVILFCVYYSQIKAGECNNK